MKSTTEMVLPSREIPKTEREIEGNVWLTAIDAAEAVLSVNAATRHGRSALQSRWAGLVRKGRAVRCAWSN